MSNSANVNQTLLLSRSEIEELLSVGEAVEAVEDAFRLTAEGKAAMPPKLYLDLPDYHGDFRAMPAYISGSAGIKWVSVYPNNQNRNLPTVLATILLCDPNTGCPLAVMDGTYITKIRTGAAGAVAAKYLAKKDSSVIGMVGAGAQARTQLMATAKVLPKIEEVKVYDKYREAGLKYAEEMGAELGINVRYVATIQEVTEADILVTTTPSTAPIVSSQLVRPGTHINAIGADAEGKQELESALLKKAKVIVDDITQASHSGEVNVPLKQGAIKVEDIYGTLGEVIANIKQGRENDQEITVFDSTGLAVQDIICAKLVYEKAIKEGKARTFKLN